MESTVISQKTYDRWFHFDSNNGSTIDADMISSTPWILKVTYLYFELDGIIWEDPTGYLCFETGNSFCQSVITQGDRGKSDIMLPIRNPQGSPSIDAYAVGIPNSDHISFRPYIKSSYFEEMEPKRLVVTFHIESNSK
tara:strand:- start:535 stop:948 length:414 start_codon:yes stop_codon:yes gene_type:complete